MNNKNIPPKRPSGAFAHPHESVVVRTWHKFPEEIPSEPGKYLVYLECDGRTWTSIKSWEWCQYHSTANNYGHGHWQSRWILGMEFRDTKVVAWAEIPEVPCNIKV